MDPSSLPTLDAHGHLDSSKPESELDAAGAVLAVTMAPDEFEAAFARHPAGRARPLIAWGLGCHPGVADAQESFDPERFRLLAEKAAFLGEIGLDKASPVPLETQRRTFRAILSIAAELGRPVSIHSQHATALVLDELERTRQPAAILHWWLGSSGQTGRAVALGCRFSVHPTIALHTRFAARVPVERVLAETDHGYGDPPAAIPARIGEAEILLAGRYNMEPAALRLRMWKNFGELVRATGIRNLLPEGITSVLDALPS